MYVRVCQIYAFNLGTPVLHPHDACCTATMASPVAAAPSPPARVVLLVDALGQPAVAALKQALLRLAASLAISEEAEDVCCPPEVGHTGCGGDVRGRQPSYVEEGGRCCWCSRSVGCSAGKRPPQDYLWYPAPDLTCARATHC